MWAKHEWKVEIVSIKELARLSPLIFFLRNFLSIFRIVNSSHSYFASPTSVPRHQSPDCVALTMIILWLFPDGRNDTTRKINATGELYVRHDKRHWRRWQNLMKTQCNFNRNESFSFRNVWLKKTLQWREKIKRRKKKRTKRENFKLRRIEIHVAAVRQRYDGTTESKGSGKSEKIKNETRTKSS